MIGRASLLFFVVVLAAGAGPVEFGRAELDRAFQERGLRRLAYRVELSQDPPESFRILPSRIAGGDLRGLMYGLLEAAEQIREHGRLLATKGSPAVPVRGVRRFVHNEDLEEDWYSSRESWREFFAMLARNRFNRFNLVFAHQTEYLAPPYPYWVELPEFPEVRVPGLSSERRDRNLEWLQFISQTAADHAIDFTLGIWQHDVQRNQKASVEGLTPGNIGPYSHAALKSILAQCPAIRSVQMRTNSESGIPGDRQVEFYRDWVFRAVGEAGRRVTLDLRGWLMPPGMLEAAIASDAPLRLSAKYWAEHIGRPHQPAETWANYSYMDFLRKPRPYEFLWELWGLGSHRLLLWGDPNYVRRAVRTFTLSGTQGFEIDPPLAQKGFGNRPGKWGVFTGAQSGRVFWDREFERYWMFYLLWGRLAYDPKTPERIWTSELRRRFGAAAPDVLEAYRSSSAVLSEIVGAHMPDPNMYVWPEINPGGLIESYRHVRPSDWRFIDSIPEAVRSQIEGLASAKQTPEQTAERLRSVASRIEQAVERAGKKVGPDHREWQGSEPDFRVLALLARYHARKQVAAERLTWFYETADRAALDTARHELQAASEVWEALVELTHGLYPDEMAFGPDDTGHWKDKLPYVHHDLKLLEERAAIFDRFGRFDFGFDFGGPVSTPRGGAYRNDPYVLENTVEPRFQPVAPNTMYSDRMGFGWITEAPRDAVEIPLTPYHEVRAVAKDPKRLPENVLFGDFIRARGAQTFRVRTGAGVFQVHFLLPDGSTHTDEIEAVHGVVDIVFPVEVWAVSGLVLRRRNDVERPVVAAKPRPKPPPRPAFVHTPPKAAIPGRPMMLALQISPAGAVKAVRLHYRPLNQLMGFKTLEAPGPSASFTIPAEDISAEWDMMYYFEVLNPQGSGWFHPDPLEATPYYVVPLEIAPVN